MREINLITEIVLRGVFNGLFIAFFQYNFPVMVQWLEIAGRSCLVAFHHWRVNAFLTNCNDLRHSTALYVICASLGLHLGGLIQLALYGSKAVKRYGILLYWKDGMYIYYNTREQTVRLEGCPCSSASVFAFLSVNLCLLDCLNAIIWFHKRRYTARHRFIHRTVLCVTCVECACLWLKVPLKHWIITLSSQLLASLPLLTQLLCGVHSPLTMITFSVLVRWILALCTFLRLLRCNYLVADFLKNWFYDNTVLPPDESTNNDSSLDVVLWRQHGPQAMSNAPNEFQFHDLSFVLYSGVSPFEAPTNSRRLCITYDLRTPLQASSNPDFPLEVYPEIDFWFVVLILALEYSQELQQIRANVNSQSHSSNLRPPSSSIPNDHQSPGSKMSHLKIPEEPFCELLGPCDSALGDMMIWCDENSRPSSSRRPGSSYRNGRKSVGDASLEQPAVGCEVSKRSPDVNTSDNRFDEEIVFSTFSQSSEPPKSDETPTKQTSVECTACESTYSTQVTPSSAELVEYIPGDSTSDKLISDHTNHVSEYNPELLRSSRMVSGEHYVVNPVMIDNFSVPAASCEPIYCGANESIPASGNPTSDQSASTESANKNADHPAKSESTNSFATAPTLCAILSTECTVGNTVPHKPYRSTSYDSYFGESSTKKRNFDISVFGVTLSEEGRLNKAESNSGNTSGGPILDSTVSNEPSCDRLSSNAPKYHKHKHGDSSPNNSSVPASSGPSDEHDQTAKGRAEELSSDNPASSLREKRNLAIIKSGSSNLGDKASPGKFESNVNVSNALLDQNLDDPALIESDSGKPCKPTPSDSYSELDLFALYEPDKPDDPKSGESISYEGCSVKPIPEDPVLDVSKRDNRPPVASASSKFKSSECGFDASEKLYFGNFETVEKSQGASDYPSPHVHTSDVSDGFVPSHCFSKVVSDAQASDLLPNYQIQDQSQSRSRSSQESESTSSKILRLDISSQRLAPQTPNFSPSFPAISSTSNHQQLAYLPHTPRRHMEKRDDSRPNSRSSVNSYLSPFLIQKSHLTSPRASPSAAAGAKTAYNSHRAPVTVDHKPARILEGAPNLSPEPRPSVSSSFSPARNLGAQLSQPKSVQFSPKTSAGLGAVSVDIYRHQRSQVPHTPSQRPEKYPEFRPASAASDKSICSPLKDDKLFQFEESEDQPPRPSSSAFPESSAAIHESRSKKKEKSKNIPEFLKRKWEYYKEICSPKKKNSEQHTLPGGGYLNDESEISALTPSPPS